MGATILWAHFTFKLEWLLPFILISTIATVIMFVVRSFLQKEKRNHNKTNKKSSLEEVTNVKIGPLG